MPASLTLCSRSSPRVPFGWAPCILLAALSLHSQAATLETEQLTRGPSHHFFGYIGHVQTIPWNANERYIVALETDFQDHMPRADDAARIVLIDTAEENAIRRLDQTRGWNPQQGTMLYWNPERPATQFFFNDRDRQSGKVFCVLYDISTGQRSREYRFPDTPVGNSGVRQQGGSFLAINYGRLARLRAVTGYPEAFDWTDGEPHPSNDGVFKVDVASGRKELLVSFAKLAEALRPVHSDIATRHLFINHTLWSRSGKRIFFFVRADFNDRMRRVNQAFVMDADGGNLTPLAQHIGGHPEWDTRDRLIGAVDKRQIVYDTDQQKIVEQLGDATIFPEPEGDIALSPDGRWLVNGYRVGEENRYVFYRLADGKFVRSEGFDVRGWTSGDLRIDGSPCWNRQSNAVVVTALAKDGTRQMFQIRVKE